MVTQYPGSLHNHTEYSNLRLRDSITRTNELIDYAIELGHKTIAFTEHEALCNTIEIEEYYKKIKKNNPDFKVIFGNEIYLCRDGMNFDNFIKGEDKYYHFILLAKNAEGHKQLRQISTRAWMRSYKTGKMVRVPTYYQDLVEIVAQNPGNIIASTACLGGFLGTKLLQWKENPTEEFYNKIKNWLISIQKIFGVNNFYLEMQPSINNEQVFVNKEILKLSKELNIPFIITTDTHYKQLEDRPIHKAFLTAQEGDRETDDFYATTYMMGDQEIREFMKDILTEEELVNSYKNILKIAEQCEDYSFLRPLKIPSLKWKEPNALHDPNVWIERIPNLKLFYNSTFDGDVRLAQLVVDKLVSDERLQYQASYDELNKNLAETWQSSEVNNTHWSAYFLNLQKILDVCWEAGTLVGAGRGSGVGFYLLYILDIIQINCLWETTPTFSWRFLNPSRVSVLDVDVDIESTRRHQVLEALRKEYGQDRVANVATFGTEKSKQAVLTAARGLGVDVDIAQYISSLIPADRGQTRTLKQCYYGDEENDFKPVALFVQEMKNNPELWEVAQRIEGLICRLGEHAGGVIFVDEPFENSTALMRAPNGDIMTQLDLHKAEAASLIKIDLLSIDALDKMHNCLDLLIEHGYIEPEDSLRKTYEKIIGVYNLERTSTEMWEMIWRHEIQALFQMEKQSGIQGIALTKPKSVDDLAVLNSIIRLMAQDKDEEQPLVKYARFKNDISLWYQEMLRYGLSRSEQELLEPIVKQSYGISESQEKFMMLVQMPECGGFDLTWADRLRKAIAKKNPAEYDKLTKEYFDNVEEKGLSQNLCNYVWNVLVATSRGYGFNASHTLAYSIVGLQEMNLAYRYPIIFWNTACLIADSGGAENSEADKSNDYDKIASAIGKMTSQGIQVVPPDINKSNFTFEPDVENNRIIYGLRGLVNVGNDIIEDIIKNRPYVSIKDFLNKVSANKKIMLSLIKAGAFDELMDRKLCMGWYLWKQCKPKSNITMSNMPGLIKYNILDESTEERQLARRVYEFNRYLKAQCKYKENYKVDERAINFLTEIGHDELIGEEFVVNAKSWDKIYQSYMNIFRNWIAANKENILSDLNTALFAEAWRNDAIGSYSAWEMESMSYYHHDHELINLNKAKYGISDFNDLPETPPIDRSFVKAGKTINMFKLTKIAGTCIAKNKDKGLVTLLTPTGVVTVKFRKDYFAMFDKQISVKNPDGTKSVVEKSWFNRGNMIMVQGVRMGDMFIAKKYASSGGHHLYRILSIDESGDIELQTERYYGGIEEDVEN